MQLAVNDLKAFMSLKNYDTVCLYPAVAPEHRMRAK